MTISRPSTEPNPSAASLPPPPPPASQLSSKSTIAPSTPGDEKHKPDTQSINGDTMPELMTVDDAENETLNTGNQSEHCSTIIDDTKQPSEPASSPLSSSAMN